ncbi:hypothetical protein Tco_0320933 [Tanacetum coccineum]
MTTLAEHIIIAGAENRPPVLEKSMYDSWESRIRLFIKGKKHGRMMLDSIDNGPLVYPTVEENRQTRPKKYSELTEAQQLQDDYDVQAMNIILHGLPPDVYALVNHQEVAKDIWDRVKMLMKGTELSYQERECRLHNLFDKFSHVLGETLYEYYWRFSQLINDMHTIGMTMLQVQEGEDPIECINKAMEFLSAVASRFPPANNQLRTSFNPRNQVTIQDDTLDAYDLDCDDLSLAKAVLMANLSSCDLEVLSKYSQQTHVGDFKDNEIHSGSNIIPYSQYLQETQDAVIQDINPSAPNDLLVLSLVEQMTNHVAHLDKENQTNKMVNESLTTELERYKERIAIFEQRLNVDLNQREKLIDSQMDDLIRDRNAKLAAF